MQFCKSQSLMNLPWQKFVDEAVHSPKQVAHYCLDMVVRVGQQELKKVAVLPASGIHRMVGFAPVVCRGSSERAAYRKESQSASYESSFHDDFDTQMDTLVGVEIKSRNLWPLIFRCLWLVPFTGQLAYTPCAETPMKNLLANDVCQILYSRCFSDLGRERWGWSEFGGFVDCGVPPGRPYTIFWSWTCLPPGISPIDSVKHCPIWFY